MRSPTALAAMALLASREALAQGNTQTSAGTSTTAASSGTSAASSGTTTGASATGTSTNLPSLTTGTSTGTSTGASTTLPSISSTGTAPPLPSLSGALPPPLIVPDTSNAPFMQKSNLPEGTVFIAVGAVLGLLALCVLAWRGFAAWSLHRSVRRAADNAYAPDAKSMFGFGQSTGYKSMYADSNMSLEQLSSSNTAYLGAAASQQRAGLDSKSSKQQKHASKGPASQSLFFSPTAGPGASAGGASNRSSTFLPSGYYASTASSQPAAPGARSAGRVQSQSGITPPESPSARPQSSHLRPAGGHSPRHSTGGSRGAVQSHEPRRSRLGQSQNAPSTPPSNNLGSGRTPSSYFDDLLENHGHGPGERF